MTYSALILQEPQKDSVRVEATYGLGKEVHPVSCSRKGTIGRVLESCKPMTIQNLGQEPLYEEIMKGTKRAEKINPPLLCVPLVADDQSIGVMNINPLHGTKAALKMPLPSSGQCRVLTSSIISAVLQQGRILL